MDKIAKIIGQSIVSDNSDWKDCLPEQHFSRQDWQELVDAWVMEIRTTFNQPDYQIPPGEVSIYYHCELREFEKALKKHLRN